MISFIRYVIVFFVLNWSVVSYASCYYKNDTTAATYTVTVPTINAQRDVLQELSYGIAVILVLQINRIYFVMGCTQSIVDMMTHH